MRTLDRGGVHLEQCDGCHGVFLDAGELEQIAAEEERYYQSPPPYQPPAGAPGRPPGGARHSDSPAPWGGSSYRDSPPGHGYGHQKKKRSFFESLFD